MVSLNFKQIAGGSTETKLGGGFEGGSSHDAPPENIIQPSAKPLIFVTFEYRLGQFGFLGQFRWYIIRIETSHFPLRRRNSGSRRRHTERGAPGSGMPCFFFGFFAYIYRRSDVIFRKLRSFGYKNISANSAATLGASFHIDPPFVTEHSK
jgi:hypothetical protein